MKKPIIITNKNQGKVLDAIIQQHQEDEVIAVDMKEKYELPKSIIDLHPKLPVKLVVFENITVPMAIWAHNFVFCASIHLYRHIQFIYCCTDWYNEMDEYLVLTEKP